MTLEFESSANNGTGAILRALASLMAALGSDDGRPRPAMREYAPAYPPAEASRPAVSRTEPPRYEQPREPRIDAPRPTGSRSGANTEAELLLDDARQRAERILQDSMERANELLARERPAPGGGPGQPLGTNEDVEALQRSVDELLLGMRDVQARLSRLESMIATAARAPMAPPAAVPPTPPTPPTPMVPTSPATPTTPRTAYPPIEEERRPGGLSVVSPQTPATPQPVRAAVPPPPPPVAPPPASVVPPSALPPVRGATQPAFVEDDDAEVAPPPAAYAYEAPTTHHEEAPAAAVHDAPASSRWERGSDVADDVAGTLATFTPADGAVLLRAAPVSGFQGLMRLQDALQRIPAIRQATVEAYSQGEARLRLELSEDVDSDEIAEGVGTGLGQNAQVREASEEDRTIVIAFE